MTIVNYLKRIMDSAVDLIAPLGATCLLCGSSYDGEYCPKCKAAILISTNPGCRICGRIITPTSAGGDPSYQGQVCRLCLNQRPIFSFAAAVGPYEGLLKEAIYLFKYTGRQSMAEFLAHLLMERIIEDDRYLSADLIVPVPLHAEKLYQRSFNQATLLAQQIGRELGLPVNSSSLVRIKNTPSQSKLTAYARKQNLAGAFVIQDNHSLVGKNILLIDDVLTTGATAEECTRVLRQAGAESVFLVVLASGRVEA